MNQKQQAKFDKIMKNCHLPTRLDMTKLIRKIEDDKENCFTYGQEQKSAEQLAKFAIAFSSYRNGFCEGILNGKN